MPQTPPNPILKRFRKLEDCWSEFTDNPEARVLRWLADEAALRMLDLFLELQNEDAGELPDLFLRMDVPFTTPDDHATALVQSLLAQFRSDRNSLQETGLNVDWSPPQVSEQCSVSELIAVLASFRQHFEAMMQHVAVALLPESVSDVRAWQRWVHELIQQPIPPDVRFFVVDHTQSPTLGDVAQQHRDRVITVDPELDMPGAYEELAAQAPGEGPAHDFRQLYIKLNNAATSGDLTSAEDHAGRAISIATQNGWQALAAAAQMALAAAYFGAGDLQAALKSYRDANAAVVDSDDPVAPKLNLQTRMAEGSTLIAAAEYAEAAEVYELAAGLAQEQGDATVEMDCWRMAGWCHENVKQNDSAWTCGEHSLAAAEAMSIEQRKTSTLAHTGRMMLRLCASKGYRNQRDAIHDRMVTLAGESWDVTAEQGDAT